MARWEGGDYSTYGQSGYSDPGRGMHRDLEREQGPHGLGRRASDAHGTGRGPKGWRRSDERIHEEVCERIARSGIDADDVEVRVDDGEITLTGTTATRSDKRMLDALCDGVLGIHDVHNQVRVRRAAPGDPAFPDPSAKPH